jgi:hypothetical protein
MASLCHSTLLHYTAEGHAQVVVCNPCTTLLYLQLLMLVDTSQQFRISSESYSSLDMTCRNGTGILIILYLQTGPLLPHNQCFS